MPAKLMEASARVVRRPTGGVLLIFWGEDAEAEAAKWAAEGYQVDAIDRSQLSD